MKISVVIPTLDEGENIQGAIESVLGGTSHPNDGGGARGADAVEICVVDGGSRDDTLDRARHRIRPGGGDSVLEIGDWAGPSDLHGSGGGGRARQLQAGFEATDGDVVVFLHADTRLEPGWIEGLSRALEPPDVAGGAFRFRFERGGAERSTPIQRAALALVEWGVRLRTALFALPYGDQALFVRRRVLEQAGGVPQVALMEDLDLVRVIKSHGRLAVLDLAATTSARRYRAFGVARTVARNAVAALGWGLGVDRARIARWYRG